MKRRIVFFLPNFQMGGAERVAVNLLRLLSVQEGMELAVVCLSDDGPLRESLPKEVTVHTLRTSRTLTSIRALRNYLRTYVPDVIYSTLPHTHIAVDLALTGLHRKPCRIFRSSSSPRLLLESGKIKGLMKVLLERAYKNADVVVAQTPEMKEELASLHRILPEKIHVLVNPIDQARIIASLQEEGSPYEEKTINLVAVGRLVPEKGFDTLIEGMQDVIAHNDMFRLHIVGEGPERSRLEALILRYGLENHVYLHGFRSNPYPYIHYADAYVLSSRREGLPNTVLEALFLQKPVIATRCIPFMQTLVVEGKNGFLVDVDDAGALAQAILRFEELDPSYRTIAFDGTDVVSLFTCEGRRS